MAQQRPTKRTLAKRRAARRNSRPTRALQMERLCDRLLLDAAGLLPTSEALPATELHDSEASRLTLPSDVRTEFVFLDESLPDLRTFVSHLQPAAAGTLRTIVRLDADSGGLQQIAQALEGARGVDAVHIVSHGSSGRLHLGNQTFSSERLRSERTELLATMRTSLDPGADLLLYGCNLADHDTGRELIATLAELTGMDVAASDDRTGHSSLGGDWQLEATRGIIETPVILSRAGQAAWRGVLPGAPIPTATPNLPMEAMINEAFDFTVTFDNTSATASDVGYAPYMDLSVPDGIDIGGATYLTAAVNMVNAGTYNMDGDLVDAMGSAVNHPLTGLTVTGGTPGETLYVVELPFGSFVPAQTPAVVTISAATNKTNGAVVGTPLTVTATGGFALGCDPLDNPATDAPISAHP